MQALGLKVGAFSVEKVCKNRPVGPLLRVGLVLALYRLKLVLFSDILGAGGS